MSSRRLGFIFLFFVCLTAFASILPLYPDLLWFESFGKAGIWFTSFKAKGLIFSVTFPIIWIWLLANVALASREPRHDDTPKSRLFSRIEQILSQFISKETRHFLVTLPGRINKAVILAGTLLFAFLLSSRQSAMWELILKYIHRTPFGSKDPIFGKDISFYFFSLPFFEFLSSSVGTLLWVTVILVAWIYLSKNGIALLFQKKVPQTRIKIHLFGLLALLAFSNAGDYWLSRFQILLQSNDLLFGATFTDMHVKLYVLTGAIALFSILGMVLLASMFMRQIAVLLTVFGIVVIYSILAPFSIGMVQKFIVTPDQLNKETPYIQNHIEATRIAYGLDKIKEEPFPANADLRFEDINSEKVLIDNVRLWNREPLKKTFSQLQEIRLYYEFENIDVDRYEIDGEMRQVMLSPRELDTSQLPREAQNWIHKHLMYTHGYGLCMAPVNQVTKEGLPEFFIKNLPPVSNINLTVTRPQIYYGESRNDYIIVNTKQEEFDHPKGDKNAYTTYQGTGGIPLDSFFKRAVFSQKFGKLNILISTLIKSDSRIIYDQSVHTIVKKLTPFITFDTDAYLVIRENGHLVWMLDGYTFTNQFPYAEPFNRNLNYIRNPVKVTIDAYNGEIHYYLMDTDDPIIKTYAKIYPDTFEPFSKMPADLQTHIRYPKTLFNIQANMLLTYHMTDPKVFYLREDGWSIPGQVINGQETQAEPYHMITKIPGESKESFITMMPFTPVRKNNMIAWLSAKCDLEDYGALKLFKFPKEKTIYGPKQIEARVDQDTEISQKLTLWGQHGSQVIRGNLMVIPIKDSLIYVQPIYLQATESQLPELKRVIFSYADKVIMGDTLEDAIEFAFKNKLSFSKEEKQTSEEKNKDARTPIIEQLKLEFSKLREAAKTLQFSEFGNRLDHINQLLESE